jgi:hypothetical protein
MDLIDSTLVQISLIEVGQRSQLRESDVVALELSREFCTVSRLRISSVKSTLNVTVLLCLPTGTGADGLPVLEEQ